MGDVLIAWEIGAGFGHLMPIMALSRAFTGRGHRVRVAARDADRARALLAPHGIEVFAAPCRRAPPRRFPLSHNYAENLLRNGYWHGEALGENLAAWRAMLDRFRPDLVVCDHAPTALLAARHTGVPRAAFGVGFMVPPRTDPMPPLQPWFTLPPRYYVESEKRFLAAVNPVLRTLGMRRLSTVADIFEGAETFLCTLPECDHYPARQDERYWGPLPCPTPGRRPVWPAGNGPRLFVYVSGLNRQFRALAEVLREVGTPVLAYVRDATPEQLESLRCDHLHLNADLVDLRFVAAECSAAVTHGGFGTVIEMLRAGIPTLLLPLELEQALLTYRLAQHDLVLQANFLNPEPDIRTKLGRLLEGGAPAGLAAFSQRHRLHDGQQAAEAIVARCETLAAA